jgi:hypothetical protein
MRTLLNGVERVLTGLQSDVWHTSRRLAGLLWRGTGPHAPAEFVRRSGPVLAPTPQR